jgi:hypothetical protein
MCQGPFLQAIGAWPLLRVQQPRRKTEAASFQRASALPDLTAPRSRHTSGPAVIRGSFRPVPKTSALNEPEDGRLLERGQKGSSGAS